MNMRCSGCFVVISATTPWCAIPGCIYDCIAALDKSHLGGFGGHTSGVYFSLTFSSMSGWQPAVFFWIPPIQSFQLPCSRFIQIKGEGFGFIFSEIEALQKYPCKGPSRSSSNSFLQLELVGTRWTWDMKRVPEPQIPSRHWWMGETAHHAARFAGLANKLWGRLFRGLGGGGRSVGLCL